LAEAAAFARRAAAPPMGGPQGRLGRWR
jgi:hypothetical protein